ncbi:MAG: hypothetical protein HOP06_06800 [Methylotenera sp.]|nr:hypothetical protein [Methylotenera sp.]
MFARTLYSDEKIRLEINWFGLGSLQTINALGKRIAHPIQKKVFIEVVDNFKQLGQDISPSNPKCARLFKEFAVLLESQPNSLT